MKLKTIIAATLCCLTLTSTARANNDLFGAIIGGLIIGGIINELTRDQPQANTTEDDNIKLWNTVKKHVPIYSDADGFCDGPGKIYGGYNPVYDAMVICDGLTYNEFYETLRHEAMHLIQDCNSGFNNAEMSTSFTHESLKQVQTQRTHKWLQSYVGEGYDVYMLEMEAFHYEVFPSNEITKLINQRCN